MTEDALIRKVPVVLQSCTMSEEDLLHPSNETVVATHNNAHEVIFIKVEENIDVNTQEQKIPVPSSFPPLKTEQDEVSYVYLCPILGTFP
jgi:hypothetical protein